MRLDDGGCEGGAHQDAQAGDEHEGPPLLHCNRGGTLPASRVKSSGDSSSDCCAAVSTRDTPRTPLREGLAPGGAGLDDLVEDLVLLHHAELEAGALLDRRVAFLEVAHLGVERVVTRLEARVALLLLREASLELPHPCPASLAQPQRVLQGEDQRGEAEGERLHVT